MLDELKVRIDADKEVLSVLPQNNLRNRRKYREKLEELHDVYQKDLDVVYNIIKEKYFLLNSVTINEDFQREEDKINGIYAKFYIFNENNTSYEKMHLDHTIYNLRKFYKNNLDEVNNNINTAIVSFSDVGIDLNSDDFQYSVYATDYMRVFFEEQENGDYNSLVVKENFEKIYWKCPDIITHIALNIIQLYYDNKRKIDKYFERTQDAIISEHGDYYTLIREYKNRLIAIDEKKNIDTYNILHLVIDEAISISDYSTEKINKLIDQLLTKRSDDNLLYGYLQKFYNSLIEYRNYLKYEYIVKDIKVIYAEKDKYKDVFKIKYKDICKKQKVIRKLNGKVRWLSKKSRGFDKIEIMNNQIVNEINELEKLYLELDLESFKEKVALNINDNSTIRDVLMLASSYYNYIIDCNKRNKVECSSNTDFINELRLYLFNPYNSVIDNLLLNSEDDKAMIISDKYKLLDFNIEPEMLDESGIDGLISNVSMIILYYNILKSGYKIEELMFVHNCKKIVQEKEKSNIAS